MLETEILNTLTNEQKQKIATILAQPTEHTFPANYVQAYIAAFECPPGQAQEDFENYMTLRALVALEWADYFSYHFRNHAGWKLALQLRLAYDMQNPQALAPNFLNYLIEQSISLFTHRSLNTRILFILAPLIATFGSAALFIGTGLLIGLGVAIPAASSIFLLSTAIALIGAGLLFGGEALLNSEYNIRRQYISKNEDESTPFSRLENWNSSDNKTYMACRDIAESDRHARPFDNLGFFKDCNANYAQDVGKELAQALTC